MKEIAKQLRARGILPWLDVWELRSGMSWQRLLEQQIEHINSAAVFVGKGGVGPWQRLELEAFLREFVKRMRPVIPVFLADASEEPILPAFLRDITEVDFRKQYPDPMDQLIWGITGERPQRGASSNTAVPSSSTIENQTSWSVSEQLAISSSMAIPPSSTSEALGDINEIRLAIGDTTFRNYRRLARTIIRRMGITKYAMIDAPHFTYGTVWEVALPRLGLQLSTQRAVLLLRQTEQDKICYDDLKERTHDNALIMVMDIADVPYTPFQSSPRTLWFSPEELLEMTGTAPDQLSAWLGRFILIKVEREIKLLLLRYQAEGAVGEDIFVGREHELMRLSRPDKLGGIIIGAHSSAYELRNEMEPVAN